MKYKIYKNYLQLRHWQYVSEDLIFSLNWDRDLSLDLRHFTLEERWFHAIAARKSKEFVARVVSALGINSVAPCLNR